MRLWHVSAPVDLAAYHFSWVPVALAFLHFRDDARGLATLALVCAVFNYLHRNWTMVYAYGDSDIRRRYSTRLYGVLGGLAATFVLLALIRGLPAHGVVIGVLAVIAGPWNVYHVQMQKFGFLRLYGRKGGAALKSSEVPAWADKLMLFGWMPAVLASKLHLAEGVLRNYMLDLAYLYETLARPVLAAGGILHMIGVVLWVASIAIWLREEWRSSRLRNSPRLCGLAGMTALASSFYWLPPLHAFLAYGFGHAVEYLVFAGAFQRKRAERPVSWMSRHWRASFAISLGGMVLFYCWWIAIPWSGLGRSLAAIGAPETVPAWVGIYAVVQQHAHYYIDGFIWKMRDPSVFRNV